MTEARLLFNSSWKCQKQAAPGILTRQRWKETTFFHHSVNCKAKLYNYRTARSEALEVPFEAAGMKFRWVCPHLLLPTAVFGTQPRPDLSISSFSASSTMPSSRQRSRCHLTTCVRPWAHRLNEDIPRAKDVCKCLEVYVLDVGWLAGWNAGALRSR